MTQQATEIVEREFEISEREWSRLADACNVALPDVSVLGNPWSVAGTGVPILVLIRESSVNKKRDLLRLLMRTLIALGDEEGVEQLRAEGIGPLLHRESYPGTIYRRLPDRGRASIRACGNVWVVLIFGSAAMENVDGNGLPVTKSAKATHNAVTMLVRSVFERLRPRICRVGGFDRLVRAYKGSSELLDTFTANVGFLQVRTSVAVDGGPERRAGVAGLHDAVDGRTQRAGRQAHRWEAQRGPVGFVAVRRGSYAAGVGDGSRTAARGVEGRLARGRAGPRGVGVWAVRYRDRPVLGRAWAPGAAVRERQDADGG